jgi:hypothetical protein
MKPSLTSTTLGLLLLAALPACTVNVPSAKSTSTVSSATAAGSVVTATVTAKPGVTPATIEAPAPKTTVEAATTTSSVSTPVLFESDFHAACAGISTSKATAYSKTPGVHPIIGFAGKGKDYSTRIMPDDWTIQWTGETDTLRAVELVGCAERTTDTFVKECPGYMIDGKGDNGIVRWHHATYAVSIREAKTGKEVGSATFEAKDDSCPFTALFVDGKTTTNDYAFDDDAFQAVLKDYVQL